MLTVRVPATIANMGPGFDTFGMAVSLYNRFDFSAADADALLFSPASRVDVSALPADPAKNILFESLDALYKEVGIERPPLEVEVQADIPVARGLGSSSTAIVAGLVAANKLLGNAFSSETLLHRAIGMEGHPDNVAPALLGGVVLYDTRPYCLPWPAEWGVMVLSPAYPVLTEEARAILPRTVSLETSIFNLRKSAVLTYALLQKDADALRDALQDQLHQPHRRKLIREYDAIEAAAMDAGAYGMIISGSGSTMAVFYPDAIREMLRQSLDATCQANGFELLMNEVSVDGAGATFEAE